jgi:radical SAM protein with 4Fe4S-binding SPASM domain
MYIWWDGKANPCEVDYKSKLSPGNLKNLNLSKLWNSNLYQSLRKNHLSSKRADVKPCDRCTVV